MGQQVNAPIIRKVVNPATGQSTVVNTAPGATQPQNPYTVPTTASGATPIDLSTAKSLTTIQNTVNEIKSRPVLQMEAAPVSPGVVIDTTKQDEFRNQQLALGKALADQANGLGPSVAGSQLQQSTDMNLQAALAQAASSRGGNLGAAQYQLGNVRANIQQQAAMQLAQARIQEQMAARAQLGEVLGAGRGADIGLATSQGQLTEGHNQFGTQIQQQTNAVNLGSAQEQQARVDDLTMKYIQMGISADQAKALADEQVRQFYADLKVRNDASIRGTDIASRGQDMQLAGGIASAVGGVVGGTVGSMAGPAGTAAGAAAGSAVGGAIPGLIQPQTKFGY